MHPLIKRAIEYQKDYMFANKGEAPPGPFLIFSSEWEDFKKHMSSRGSKSPLDLEDPNNFLIAGMDILIIADREHTE